MKARSILVALAIVAVATVCVRLGFWQISRLHEKRALNAALRAALAAPPIAVGRELPPLEMARGRRLEARGHYDEKRQVLLGPRSHDGSPGVDVVTPLLLPGDSVAILVNRGWLYAPDAMTARPDRYLEPGERVVVGIADSMRHGSGGPPIRTLDPDTTHLIAAVWIDRDSIASRFPYALAPYVLRQLPGPGVPANPVRRPVRPFDEAMHLSYAVQWFVFATILVGGSSLLAWKRSRRREIRVVPKHT